MVGPRIFGQVDEIEAIRWASGNPNRDVQIRRYAGCLKGDQWQDYGMRRCYGMHVDRVTEASSCRTNSPKRSKFFLKTRNSIRSKLPGAFGVSWKEIQVPRKSEIYANSMGSKALRVVSVRY